MYSEDIIIRERAESKTINYSENLFVEKISMRQLDQKVEEE